MMKSAIPEPEWRFFIGNYFREIGVGTFARENCARIAEKKLYIFLLSAKSYIFAIAFAEQAQKS
jgi:hypothetical protein